VDTFFIEFRDPLFGVIVFFVIIFVITFLSYWFNRYKQRESYKHLDKFLKQFNALPSQDELRVLISSGDLSEKSWLLLANSYSKNGNFDKSVEIYTELLKVGNKDNYRDTLFLLGKTYFKAGFLERAKQIFLEILQNNPRTPQALNYLLLVYENMRDYKSALGVLEPLEELGMDVVIQKDYLNALVILNNEEYNSSQKTQKLLEIYEKRHHLTYLIFEYMFRVNPALAWQNLDLSQVDLLVDILYNIDEKDINIGIIKQSAYLRELYTAKGYVNEAEKSSIFEFDVLINLNKKVNATLSFEYVCDNCKGVFPFAFHRCSSCHAIDSSKVEISLAKDYHKDFGEENNSFQ
jgi:tetratricopeptide (TPR) repeat protein